MIIRHDLALLRALMDDSGVAGPLWQPTAYWRGYCARIGKELAASDLSQFRRNYALLKGYADGGTPEPSLPRNRLKRAIWLGLERVPAFDRIVAEYRRLVAAQTASRRREMVRYAWLVCERLHEGGMLKRVPSGLAAGNPETAFDWRGHRVTADWATYLVRAAAFYAVVDSRRVTSIVEIGSGIGLSTLAHLALNPYLELVVNIDLPPVLYIATQYLRASSEFVVVDYRAERAQATVVPRHTAGRPTVYMLPPWQVPALSLRANAFFNAFSFQEMERDVCENYARELLERCRVSDHVVLDAWDSGHKPGAGGQQAPISLEFLVGLFQSRFPNRRTLDQSAFEPKIPGTQSVLLSRNIAA